MSLFRLRAVAVFALAALAAAPVVGKSDEPLLELARAHAGAPVKTARFLTTYDYQPLSRNTLLIWETRSRAYLVTVDNFCVELEHAIEIGISHHGSSLQVGNDSIVARGQRCFIEEIRPLDVVAFKAARKQARADAKAGIAPPAQAPSGE